MSSQLQNELFASDLTRGSESETTQCSQLVTHLPCPIHYTHPHLVALRTVRWSLCVRLSHVVKPRMLQVQETPPAYAKARPESADQHAAGNCKVRTNTRKCLHGLLTHDVTHPTPQQHTPHTHLQNMLTSPLTFIHSSHSSADHTHPLTSPLTHTFTSPLTHTHHTPHTHTPHPSHTYTPHPSHTHSPHPHTHTHLTFHTHTPHLSHTHTSPFTHTHLIPHTTHTHLPTPHASLPCPPNSQAAVLQQSLDLVELRGKGGSGDNLPSP